MLSAFAKCIPTMIGARGVLRPCVRRTSPNRPHESVRLIRISNFNSPTLPGKSTLCESTLAKSTLSPISTPAASTDQDHEDAHRKAGPAADALDILSEQILQLLARCLPSAPEPFVEAISAWVANLQQPMTSKQAVTLLRAIRQLPDDSRVPEPQLMLRGALYDLTRAARAEAMLHEQIARHTRREGAYALPGSQHGAGTTGMLGVLAGLPGALDAGGSTGGRYETSTATFDDMTVATLRSTTVVGDGIARAIIAPAVGLTGTLSGCPTYSNVAISLSMRAHVLRLAHASVERRLGGRGLQRAVKQLMERRRDRYDERSSRAIAWQSRLPFLLHSNAPTAPLQASRRALLLSARMTTYAGDASASAGCWGAQASPTGAISRTKLRSYLPTRLTELDAAGLPATQDPAVRHALETRMADLLERAPPHSPALQAVRQVREAQDGQDELARRLDAIAHVRAAFDHLQALAELSLRAPAQASAPLASLARDWGAATGAREPVMIAMLDTLAWLQAIPDVGTTSTPADRARLRRAIQADARCIHDTPMPHDRRRVYRATHAFRKQIQRIATSRGALSLSVSIPLLSATGEVSLARHKRQDPDPLRAGTYLELTFSAQLSPALGTILAEVEQQLPEWGSLPLREVQALIHPLGVDIGLTLATQYVLRFFRPAFQSDPDFPAAACGSHLHAVRLVTRTTQTLGGTVAIPVLPAIAPTLTVEHTRTTQHTRQDRLGESTLTSALLRYMSLRSAHQRPEQTWAALLASHGSDLDRLAAALVDPCSVPAQEARYWLQREPATTTGAAASRRDRPDTRVLDAFKHATDGGVRRAQLHALFEAVGAITARQKAMSPLIGPLLLSVKR
ncbi:hypothetical protein [Stenotrophomonas sp. PD6]|uniref:hypothetical protein n=1 Tax=Stenotrophomonas sp. PD6 TaxID=3368612 RepID=UPI003BA04903